LAEQQETIADKSAITRTLLGIAGFIALILGLFVASMLAPKTLSRDAYLTLGYYPLGETREISDFQLTDHTGQAFTRDSLTGQWSLLFFGFTWCPDVCPTTLAKLNKVIRQLEPEVLNNLQVVLVTVDPERDTPEILRPYLETFNSGFKGVTGDFDQIVALATRLNIAFGKVPGDEPGTYTVDHSASIVVINPQARYHGFLKPPHSTENMLEVFRALVGT
jgi:protein SCO1/2